MIDIIGVSKTYSQQVLLNAIDLSIHAGECFGIIGRSGVGKSTLLRLINRLEKPSAGQIRIDNKDIATLSAAALRHVQHQMGMIFQHFNLMNTRSVYENIALPLEFMGYSSTRIRERVNNLLSFIGMQNQRHAYPSVLSGGQKQRVAIARALAAEPKILLCDEPTSALDPENSKMILVLLRELCDKLNITIVIITHELDVIKSVCDRVALLHQGKIIEQAPILTFLHHPVSTEAKQWLRHAQQMEIPDFLRQDLVPQPETGRQPLLCLSFFGPNTSKPLISEIIQHFDVRINILLANIEPIQKNLAGHLVLTLGGTSAAIEKSMAFLSQHDIHIEVLGYVSESFFAV